MVVEISMWCFDVCEPESSTESRRGIVGADAGNAVADRRRWWRSLGPRGDDIYDGIVIYEAL